MRVVADVAPTLLTLAGIEPGPTDGLDLGPLLSSEDQAIAHDTLHFQTRHESAVRSGRWKLRTATDDGHAKYEMVELDPYIEMVEGIAK